MRQFHTEEGATFASYMLASLYQLTWRHSSEAQNTKALRCKNL